MRGMFHAEARSWIRYSLPAILLVTAMSVVGLAAQPPSASALIPAGGPGETQAGSSMLPVEEGKARTSLFGLSGEGYRFVYVFDRSGSMGGSGKTSLRAVKAELRKSLENLGSVHQFQIIFYNERPLVFNPTGIAGKLAFANDANKARALRFIDSVVADGGTEHEEALRQATSLKPDVIFFLTDGDEPILTESQLERIGRWATGITINTIQFGKGPQPAEDGFLVKLAQQTGGKYAYVDTASFAGCGTK
jgi:hypothetical protein